MSNWAWQPELPINSIIFDCDGTLSTLEGIDELAKDTGFPDMISQMTADAMGKTGITEEIYRKRLNLVKPSQKKVFELGHHYFENRVEDVIDVILILKRLQKKVYIISAGLLPAVYRFGEFLQIPTENIFAVDVEFDSHGQYLDFDHTSPLINNNGKREIISELKKTNEKIIYIGDGLNDYAVNDLVDRFIGYGGVFYRPNIEALSQYYIATFSLAPLLALSLTKEEYTQLNSEEKKLFEKGIQSIEEGKVIIKGF